MAISTREKLGAALAESQYLLTGGSACSYRERFTYRCSKGHSGSSTVSNFLEGKRCGACSVEAKASARRKDVELIRAALAQEGYVLHTSFIKNNRTPFECICPNGHSWKTTWTNFKYRRDRCTHPTCKTPHGLVLPYSEAVVPIVQEGYEILAGEEGYTNTHSFVTVVCPLRHAPYRVQIYNFRNGRRCPGCACHSSLGERAMTDFVRSLDPQAAATRSIISPLEIDVFSQAHSVGVEFNGLFWHSEAAGKDRLYHKDKADRADAAGIRLLQFFEDEWQTRQDLVKAMITRAFGLNITTSVHARECEVQQVDTDERRTFLSANHLQGDARSAVCWGLYRGEQLLQVLSLRRATYTGGADFWEICRLATRSDCQVVGGLSRLLSRAKDWLLQRGVTELRTFADRRYSNGRAYLAVGFKSLGATEPGYFYTDYKQRFHRFAMRKDEDCPPGMTEGEYRRNQGLVRIWDAGQLRFGVNLGG